MYFDPTSRALRLFRKSRGLTQEETEEITGVDQGTISSWEKGRQQPTRKNLREYLQKLECTPEELAGFQLQALLDEFGRLNYDSKSLWERFGYSRDLGKLEYALKDRLKETREILDQLPTTEIDHIYMKNRLRRCESLWSLSITEYEDIDRIIKDRWDNEAK